MFITLLPPYLVSNMREAEIEPAVLDSVATRLEELRKTKHGKTVPFSELQRLASQLGAQYQATGKKRGKGSQERFFHPAVKQFKSDVWQHGLFGVHLASTGRPEVRAHDMKKFFLPALEFLVEYHRYVLRKRIEGKKNR